MSIVNKLTILDKNGNPKTVANTSSSQITGDVKFVGSNGIAVTSDDGILLSVDANTANVNDPVYLAKWLDIVEGSGGYSGVPYYISSINGRTPAVDGTFFLVGSLCAQLGLFDNADEAVVNPSPTAYGVELFDMCEACVDCADYDKLFSYISRIKEWLDANKDANLTTDLQLFKQYQATVHYWNYLVHSQSLLFQVRDSFSSPEIIVGYRCVDCGPFNNVRITVTVNQVSGQSVTGTWSTYDLFLEPKTLDVTTTTLAGKRLIDIQSIDKGEAVVANLIYDLKGDADDSSSSSGGAEGDQNIFDVTVRWEGTGIGHPVVRTKQINLSIL